MSRLTVADLRPNTHLNKASFLLAEMSQATDRNGNDYLKLTLRDRTGDIQARYWRVPSGVVEELATGSGSAVNFLPNDNRYIGTDISPGLLSKAAKNFRTAGFKNAEFYVAQSEDLPFGNNLFDVVLCILSLNFFKDINRVLQEI